jgi:UDP-2-acetamido-3-amino-2,3-dideoxy-glucuronate N-acetyltransferase
MNSEAYFLHPSAIVDEDCIIGRGTKIWHFSHLMTGCTLGENCVIGQNVFIASKVVLGNNVKVQNNVSIYEGVHCEDDVFLGPSMVFTNVTNPRSSVSRKNEFKTTLVKKGATIGANATVICGNEIGTYAFIGAGSVVTHPVQAYALVAGNPARQIGWMSEHGNRLQFDVMGFAVCEETGDRYLLEHNSVRKITSP